MLPKTTGIKEHKVAKGVLLIEAVVVCEFCARGSVCAVLHLLFLGLPSEGCRRIFRVEVGVSP